MTLANSTHALASQPAYIVPSPVKYVIQSQYTSPSPATLRKIAPHPRPMSRHKEASLRHLPGQFWSVGGPKVEDIMQGNAGNCFYLSLLGSIAHKKPELITSALTMTHEQNLSGKYEVAYLSQDGSRCSIEVDLLHYCDQEGKPLYAKQRPHDGDHPIIWPTLMELWYAKVKSCEWPQQPVAHFDGFDGIGFGGFPDKPYFLLSGRQMKNVSQPQMTEELLNEILDKVNRGGIAVFSTPGGCLHPGLSGPHAYSVLGTRGPWVDFFDPHGYGVSLHRSEVLKNMYHYYYDDPISPSDTQPDKLRPDAGLKV